MCLIAGNDPIERALRDGVRAAPPAEGSVEAMGKMDGGVEFSVAEGVLHIYGAERVRVASGEGVERTEVRLDEHGLKSKTRGLDSGDDVEQVEVGVGAPGVGVGTGGFGLLGPGGEAERDHIAPRL